MDVTDLDSLVTIILKVLDSKWFLAFCGVFVWPLLTHAVDRIKNKSKDKILQANVDSMVKVDHILNNSLKNLPINRAMIMKGHNSGDRPSVLNPMFVTCLNESSTPDVKSILHDIQKMPIDAEHTKIIKRLLLNEKTQVIRESLPKGGALRPFYEQFGNKWSKLYLLKSNDKALVYLVLLFTENAPLRDELNNEQIIYMNTMVNNIKNIIKDVKL